MSYRLKARESLSKGIKRIATQQIDKAISDLSVTDETNVDEAVHQARKRLKKTRAVIRLVRDRLGKDLYIQENARYRDIGRKLANLRDSKVQIETLDNLTALGYTDDNFADIRQELQIDYRREYQRVLNEGIIISVKNELKDAKTQINDWKIKSSGWKVVDKSLKQVYKRGYEGLDLAMSKPTAENLHDWRKRVKYLRYHLCILSPIWTEIIEEWVDRTHDLSDYLGEDHDLAVLQEFVSNQPKRFDRQNTLKSLNALIDRRRKELQPEAIFIGKKIYTEKDKRFVKRLNNYWKIWQEEQQFAS